MDDLEWGASDVISLTYISSASRELSHSEIEQLLATSRHNNALAELTGMLLYADEHFIQTIEGDERRVNDTLETIRADTRHHSVVVALSDEIDKRSFPEWSMGCKVLTAEQVAAIPGFNDYLDPRSELYKNTKQLGRAGVFHRIFRDTMRPRPW